MSAKGRARPEVNEKSVNGQRSFSAKKLARSEVNEKSGYGQRSMTTKGQVMNKRHCQFMLRVQQLNFFHSYLFIKIHKKDMIFGYGQKFL